MSTLCITHRQVGEALSKRLARSVRDREKFSGASGDSPGLFIIQKNRIMGRKRWDIGHGRKGK